MELRAISPNEVPLQALSCWDLFETGLAVFCLVFGSIAGCSASLLSRGTLSVRTILAAAQSLPAMVPLILSLPRSFPCHSAIFQPQHHLVIMFQNHLCRGTCFVKPRHNSWETHLLGLLTFE